MSSRRISLPGLGRRPLVIASLDDFQRLEADAETAVRMGADALEVRADAFPRKVLRPEPLRDVLELLRKELRKPLILTLRSRAEGGHLPGGFSELDRLNLFRAGLTEVNVVDVELSADDINGHVVFEAHKRKRSVILSYHNFKLTPPDSVFNNLVRKAQRLKGDILKVAVKSQNAGDVKRLMSYCENVSVKHRAFISMGPQGVATRTQGFLHGSHLSYACVSKPAAPGQFTVKETVLALQKSLLPPK
jgi:3-dehydroquinate dehydratase I